MGSSQLDGAFIFGTCIFGHERFVAYPDRTAFLRTTFRIAGSLAETPQVEDFSACSAMRALVIYARHES